MLDLLHVIALTVKILRLPVVQISGNSKRTQKSAVNYMSIMQ